MSGPLPQYRQATVPTGEIKGYKTVVDKVHPGRKGEHPTYTFKDVPLFKHKFAPPAADKPSKHSKARGAGQKAWLLQLAIRKKVQVAMDWMQANDKGWEAAVEAGLLPRKVLEDLNILKPKDTDGQAA